MLVPITLLAAATLPAGWAPWAARPEIAPRTFVDTVHYRKAPGSLAISGASNAAAYGGWEREVPRIDPGKWYRLTAYYRAEAVEHEQLQVLARLDWRRADGKRAGQPDYAVHVTPDGEWKRVNLEAPAPESAASAKLQLYLANAPQGTVWWDDISLDPIATPAPRQISVAAINFRPSRAPTAEENVRRFVETVEKAVTAKADIILLPEGITVVGTGKKYADVAETIPGPTTARLGDLAKRRHAYIVAGIFEREGAAIYNTSVLIDRAQRLRRSSNALMSGAHETRG